MATNLRPIPPPLSERMTDDGGIITAAWANFFNNIYRFQKTIDDVADDATYTIGLGTTDGEITIENGVITDIQEVVA